MSKTKETSKNGQNIRKHGRSIKINQAINQKRYLGEQRAILCGGLADKILERLAFKGYITYISRD